MNDAPSEPALRLPASTRLTYAALRAQDAVFILELLTDPDFVRYIGDRGVHTLEAAHRYIEEGPRASYATLGFGLLRVGQESKLNPEPLGRPAGDLPL